MSDDKSGWKIERDREMRKSLWGLAWLTIICFTAIAIVWMVTR